MRKATIRDYRDLLVWQKAIELAITCEKVCLELPGRAHRLTDPIGRAALSIPANIAEGNGRFSRPDYIKHLSIANGSVRELESHLHFARRVHGQTESLNTALDLTLVVAKLLGGLVRSLRGKKRGE